MITAQSVILGNKRREAVAANHQGYEIDPEDWSGLMTDNLRDHFDRMGEEIVRHDVTNHNYGEKEKHFAALHWLDL